MPDFGSLSLTYSTDISSVSGGSSGPWLPNISGKWTLKEERVTWDNSTSIRICMELGTETGYESYLEAIRWYRLGEPGAYWYI